MVNSTSQHLNVITTLSEQPEGSLPSEIELYNAERELYPYLNQAQVKAPESCVQKILDYSLASGRK